MRQDIFKAIAVVLFCIGINALSADQSPETWSDEFHNLFSDSEYQSAPIEVWEIAGSNALIDSLNLLEIDITDIHAIVSLNPQSSEIDTTYFDNAVPDDNLDDSAVFNELIEFVNTRELNVADHIRLLIPPGIYNFNNQIVMRSNISLKGAGSDMTELRFLILSDSVMTKADCQKDAIQINGNIDAIINNVGIEDLKIVRIRQGLSAKKVKARVAIPYSLPKAS